MDPITGAIVAIVIWFVLLFPSGLLVWIGGVVGAIITEGTDSEGVPIVVGVILGWIAGVAWFIFAAIQLVLQIVHLVQLLNGQVAV